MYLAGLNNFPLLIYSQNQFLTTIFVDRDEKCLIVSLIVPKPPNS